MRKLIVLAALGGVLVLGACASDGAYVGGGGGGHFTAGHLPR